jgi:hypothetical protein
MCEFTAKGCDPCRRHERPGSAIAEDVCHEVTCQSREGCMHGCMGACLHARIRSTPTILPRVSGQGAREGFVAATTPRGTIEEWPAGDLYPCGKAAAQVAGRQRRAASMRAIGGPWGCRRPRCDCRPDGTRERCPRSARLAMRHPPGGDAPENSATRQACNCFSPRSTGVPTPSPPMGRK